MAKRRQKKTVTDADCQEELCFPPLGACLNHCHGPLNPKEVGEGMLQVHLYTLFFR